MFQEFKNFLMRGNIIDLAVAVVIGAAFTLVVNSLVDDVINPIIAAIVGKPDFSDLVINVGDAQIRYGSFITALINFVLVAAAIFFFVLKPVNAIMARTKKEEAATTRACPECLSDIPVAATRCAHCGIAVAPAA
ncbi:MAG: large conductance mechanosensitive channel protein MscL [Thermomicrobiales bacterium]|nr:large conductance mechanosensitive channel protein MscL [Thermomicrobiales bacterium]